MTKRAKILLATAAALLAGGVLADPFVLGNIVLLQKFVTASIPAASATNEGGIVYDDTLNVPFFSNGTANKSFNGGAQPLAQFGALCTNMGAGVCNAGINWLGGWTPTATFPASKFTTIACNVDTPIGASASIGIEIFNVTDATSVCSCSLAGLCTTGSGALDPVTCSCNTNITNGKTYSIRTTATGGCTSIGIACNAAVEPQ